MLVPTPSNARFGLATALLVLAAAGAALAAAALVNRAAAQTIAAAPVSFGTVALDGRDRVVPGTTSAWQVDASDAADGWNITVAAGDFTDGAGHTIAAHNLEVRLPETGIVEVSGDGTLPASAQTDFAPLSGAGLKIASAAVEAAGMYELTPEFRLTVPAETYAGSYTATLTVAANTGP